MTDIDWTTDERLIQMFRDAEVRREQARPFRWVRPVLGAVLALGVSMALWTGFIYACLYAYGWLTR